MWLRSLLGSLAAFLLPGCVLLETPLSMPVLANAEVARDFDSYAIRRIGLMPFTGRDLSDIQAQALQLSFHTELSQSAPYELVLLDARDLEEVETSEPHRRGWYRPRTIIGLSRRYSLDGIVFGTVTQKRFFPPQILSLSVDLVAAETGLVIWSAATHLDATDQRVIDGLRIYYGDDNEAAGWQLALLSPERFGRFAAHQIARMF